MTGRTTRLSVLLVLALLGQLWTANAASAPLDPFPLGTVGCLVADVCSEGELCVNDKLFGHCRSRLSPDVRYDYRLTLSARELRRLGETIASLVADQFTWRDAFTQCVIQNTLVAFARDQVPFHQRQCTQALMAVVEQGPMAEAEAARGRGTFGADAEIAAVLRDLLLLDQSRQEEGKVSTFDLDGASVPDLGLAPKDSDLATLGLRGQSDKRDEIVHVHKYFAQDPSDALKRQNPGDLGRDFAPAMADLDPLVPPYGKMGAGRDDLTYDDLQHYVASVEQLMEGSRAAEKEVTDMAGGPAPPSDQLLLKEAEKVMEPETADKGPKVLAISPPDERVLEQIMTGKLDPRELKGDQLRRLIKYIDSMVSVFDENEGEGPSQADLATAAESLIHADQSMSQADGEARPEDNNIGAGYVGEPLPLDKKRVDAPPQQEHLPEAAHLKDNKEVVDTRYAFIQVKEKVGMPQALDFLDAVAIVLNISSDIFSDIHVTEGNKITFQVLPRGENSLNASTLANNVDQSDVISQLSKATGLNVVETGLGNDKESIAVEKLEAKVKIVNGFAQSQVSVTRGDGRYVVLTLVLVGCIAGVLLAAVVIYLVKRHAISRQKLAQLAASGDNNEASRDYQDLCRQRMQSKSSEKPEPLHAASRIGSVSESQVRSPSSRSSTSSWSEEPVASNMDISTGHIVLSYMEDHLKNQDRLDQEWEALCAYEADPSASKVAMDASNQRKNRYSDVLPYDHSRVSLSPSTNVSGSDYINASFITDHDPRNPAYIACQGPLPHTVADFWQMVWEQGSVVIVMLTKLTENGTALCHRYWPEEGSDLYHIYEVHLVSEHIWCDDYLVRSFYLKNLQTNETRTVTQFHFLTWPQLAVPASIKALLDFRRKVNKSYRGRSCPIVVHCSDGCGRAGTYILVDMVLNRMAKGAKEIDMAATLEHIRDQRMAMVKTKEQFQFALAAVAEEVNAILKALPQ